MSDASSSFGLKQRLNIWIKGQQKRRLMIVLTVGLGVAFVGYNFFTDSAPHPKKIARKVPNLTGVVSEDFNDSATLSLQSEQAHDIKKLTETVIGLQKNLEVLKSEAATQQNEATQKIAELEAKLSPSSASNLVVSGVENAAQNAVLQSHSGLPMTTVSYQTVSEDVERRRMDHKLKTPNNYVPAGTFVRAMLLGGADASASVNAQGNPTPVLFRILDSGTLPNNHHSHLKGCLTLGGTWGDVSSERGTIGLTSLTCVRKDGTILDTPIDGTIFGIGGKNGVRGNVVMRNGKILMYAGMSGMLSGVGSALQQSMTVQSISPLGSTNTVPSNDVFRYGLYGGANTALSKLSDYYIHRADQYHPIIELGSGTIVDIVFQRGFYLDDSENTAPPQYPYRDAVNGKKVTGSPTSNDFASLMQNAHVGDTLSPSGELQ